MPTLSKERRGFLKRATTRYQENLAEAEEFLARRGLDLEFAKDAGLGVVRNPEALHQEYEGRLAIPYLTNAGPMNMTFRCLKEHNCKLEGCAKYRKVKGWGDRLYGVQYLALADEWIAVAEGEIDAMILQQAGIPAVGAPGAEGFKPKWANVFEDFSRVYVFGDGDSAGKDMVNKWRDSVDTAIIDARMPDGEDVNSMFLAKGAEFLIGKIRK